MWGNDGKEARGQSRDMPRNIRPIRRIRWIPHEKPSFEMVVSEKLVVAAGGSHGVVLDGNGRIAPHASWQDVASRGVLLDMAGERGGAPVPRIAFRSIAAGKVETGFADGAVFCNPADTDGGLAMLLGRVAVPAQFGEAPPAPCLLRIVLSGRGGGGLLGARRDGSTASETLETDGDDHPLFRHGIASVPLAGLETVGCLSLTRNRLRGIPGPTFLARAQDGGVSQDFT